MNSSETSFQKRNFFHPFAIKKEQENFGDIMQSIRDGISFRGTNLWVLIFAILIASIGLNVNSTAVIIGAMLISPLMWPIIGIGVSIGINDSLLFKRAIRNFLFAMSVSLFTSTLYFLISPLSEAHSELLARTSPNIYDVLIALFGGLAGIIAIVSQKKWNVIPGVAIATALMPPLCTAGYGIATMRADFFLGALYLFFINSVFIAFAAVVVSRLLRFPYREFPDESERMRSRNLIAFSLILTLIPSIYFGYDMIRQNTFAQNAHTFIENEAAFPDNYLLKRQIDAKNQSILLIYGGKPITDEQIQIANDSLKKYDLEGAQLSIRQGFASLYESPKNEPNINQNQVKIEELTAALSEKEKALNAIEITKQENITLGESLFREMNVLFPVITHVSLLSGTQISAERTDEASMILIEYRDTLDATAQTQIREWLHTRLHDATFTLLFRASPEAMSESSGEPDSTPDPSL